MRRPSLMASLWFAVAAAVCSIASASEAWPLHSLDRTSLAQALPGSDAQRAQSPERPAGSKEASQPAVPGALTRYNDSIVRVETRIVAGGTTVPALGARRSGTGVILDAQTVLTIGYLIVEAEDVSVVTSDGRALPALAAAYDHATGFGLVRTLVPMTGAAMPLGDSDRLDSRQTVLTIGQGEPMATEIVVISRKPFTGNWEYLLEKGIFTFPPVNNWSGAALIDADGALVGIGALIVQDAASDHPGVPGNLYVPVNILKPILQDLQTRGRRTDPPLPWLGLATEQVRGNLMVTRVSRNGPAEAAGIEPGDIVVGVGDDQVSDRADFYRRVWKIGPAGSTIPLRLFKGGALREIPVRSVDRAQTLRKPAGI